MFSLVILDVYKHWRATSAHHFAPEVELVAVAGANPAWSGFTNLTVSCYILHEKPVQKPNETLRSYSYL